MPARVYLHMKIATPYSGPVVISASIKELGLYLLSVLGAAEMQA